jgi:hypothetical protein
MIVTRYGFKSIYRFRQSEELDNRESGILVNFLVRFDCRAMSRKCVICGAVERARDYHRGVSLSSRAVEARKAHFEAR